MMLARFASQIVAGILAALIYDHSSRLGFELPETRNPQDILVVEERRRELEAKTQKINELGNLATSGNPEKIFELAILGISDDFDDKEIEKASIGLLAIIVESERCGDNWQKYAQRSRIFLGSYLSEPYKTPERVESVCEST